MTDYSALAPSPKLGAWTRHRVPCDPNAIDLGFWIRQDRDRNSVRAMVTVDLGDVGGDGAGQWLQLSVSRPTRLPTWGDLVLARDELGYGDRIFVQLLPPRRAWMNLHSYCLHLWHRLDADTVPPVIWDNGAGDGANYRAAGALTGGKVT